MEFMTSCKQIKRIIDESDCPDALPFVASGHLSKCGECQVFAEERTKLRQMLASPARVNAPANFDAILRERLQERTARRSLAWLSPAGYWKLGAATAGLLAFFVTAQYIVTPPDSAKSVVPPNPGPMAVVPPTPSPQSGSPNSVEMTESTQPQRSITVADRGRREPYRATVQPVSMARGRNVPPPDVVILRGPDGEMEVPVRTVSVGAQPVLYVSGGQPSAPPVRATF